MGKFKMSHLLGLGRKTPKQSTQPTSNFQHLAIHVDNDTSGSTQQDQGMTLINNNDDQPTAPKKHSRGHNVAVSEEAENNPVLAVKLLRETDLSSNKIKARLREEPQALSKYTIKYMEENDPTWEFLDDDEQAVKALTLSSQYGDINGYVKARQQAVSALKKMVESMTQDEVQKLIEKTRQDMNAINPNTADNTAARQKADESYQQEIAKAAEKLHKVYEQTGATFRG